MPIDKIDYIKFISPEKKIENKKTDDEKKLKQATEDFESIFLKMMIDSMDKTVDRKKSPFYGGHAEEIFRGMLNEERAKDMSKNGGVGLSKMLYEQLSKGIEKEDKKNKKGE